MSTWKLRRSDPEGKWEVVEAPTDLRGTEVTLSFLSLCPGGERLEDPENIADARQRAEAEVDGNIVIIPRDAAVFYDPDCDLTFVQAWYCLE